MAEWDRISAREPARQREGPDQAPDERGDRGTKRSVRRELALVGVIVLVLTGVGFLLYLNAPAKPGQMPTFALGWALVVFLGLRFLTGRLLGVRLGLLGSVVSGGLAVGAGFGLQAAIDPHGGVAPFALFAVLSLLATMAFVALVGLARRPTTGTFEPPAGPPRPLRALQMRTARTTRYLGILELSARYGLGPLRTFRHSHDQRELGAALRDGLQEAGGVFVKFGQFLSARTDLVPEAIALELSGLQDDVAPTAAQAVRAVIRGELGPSVDELFVEFDERPLAAASIAQVHRARLASGAEVIVKVQRPDIERLVDRDLDILLRLAATLEERAWARRIGAVALARGFADSLHQELDFRVEAQNLVVVAANERSLRIPHVYRELSTRRVLVEEFIDGRTLRTVREELTPAQRTQLARSLLDGVFTQILTSGVFHGDPHAGNILVDGRGRVALLDFGSVGRLDRLQLPAVTRALVAIARSHPGLLADALLALSSHSDDVIDRDGLERALARFLVQRLGAGMEPGAEILNDLLRLVVGHGLALDPQLAALFRSLATLDGTLRVIDPTFKLVVEAQHFVEDHGLGLPRPAQLRDAALDDLLELLPTLRRIPRRLDRISGALERGELTLRLRPLAHPHDVRLVTRLTNRLILAFMSASIGVVSIFLLQLGRGPALFETHLDVVLGYGGLIAATVLGLRVLVAITRDGG
jgi:ubiquinone biosynthesis protein